MERTSKEPIEKKIVTRKKVSKKKEDISISDVPIVAEIVQKLPEVHIPVTPIGPVEIEWRKIDGGSLRLRNGKIVKPNEVFKAFESDISPAFRSSVVPTDPKSYIAEQDKPIDLTKAVYTIEAADDDNNTHFNVVNAAGKILNEKLLTIEEAEDLVTALKK